MSEINFQCPDCGIFFQDSEEGARFAAEHTRLTGHNEDLMSVDIDQLLEKGRNIIDALSPVKSQTSIIDLLKKVCETQEAERQ